MGDEVPPLGLLDAHRRALTVGLVLVVTMVAFEALAVATALPKTVDELGGVSLYGWTFSAFMLGNLIGITVAGHQADVRGPAPPLVAGLVLFAAGLVICGAAPSMAVVVVGRAVQGLGAGAVPAVAYVAIGRAYPEALRPRMFAVMSSAWVVPGIVGPGVAGFVAEHLSWRLVFLGLLPLLPLGGGLLIPALRRLGPTAASAPSQTRHRGAAGGGRRPAPRRSRPALARRPPARGGRGARGVPRPASGCCPRARCRAAPGLPAAVTMRSLQTFSFFGAEAFLPLMLTSVRGQSTTVAGLALTAATLSWTAGAWMQARLATRRSVRSVSVAGLVLLAAGIGLIATVLLDAVPVAVAAAGGASPGSAWACRTRWRRWSCWRRHPRTAVGVGVGPAAAGRRARRRARHRFGRGDRRRGRSRRRGAGARASPPSTRSCSPSPCSGRWWPFACPGAPRPAPPLTSSAERQRGVAPRPSASCVATVSSGRPSAERDFDVGGRAGRRVAPAARRAPASARPAPPHRQAGGRARRAPRRRRCRRA